MRWSRYGNLELPAVRLCNLHETDLYVASSRYSRYGNRARKSKVSPRIPWELGLMYSRPKWLAVVTKWHLSLWRGEGNWTAR